MVIKRATTDPARRLQLYSRISTFNEILFSFVNVDGSNYDYSVVEAFEIGIKTAKGEDDFLTLTEDSGGGLTRVPANKLLAEIDENQSAAFTQKSYYLELRRTIDGKLKVWVTGPHIWHEGEFDGVTPNQSELTIYEGDTIIQLIIGSDASVLNRDPDWNFADNGDTFPEAEASGMVFVAEDDHGNPGDADYVPAGTWMISKVAGADAFADYFYKL